VSDTPLPLSTRLWFAWVCFFRTLFDADFAARAWSIRPALPAPEPAPSTDSALQLLGLLQREGRLIDFLEQDIAGFADAEVGAAARAVHEGARKALHAHLTLEPVRTEEEGVKVTLTEGYDAMTIKLSGNVSGTAPFTGVLRHRGWQATSLSLPVAVKGHDVKVICPAEVEI